jgi:hypothetical protein
MFCYYGYYQTRILHANWMVGALCYIVFFSIDPISPAALPPQGRLCSQRKRAPGILLGGKRLPTCKVDNPTVIREPTVRKKCKPRRLTTQRKTTARLILTLVVSSRYHCYSDLIRATGCWIQAPYRPHRKYGLYWWWSLFTARFPSNRRSTIVC